VHEKNIESVFSADDKKGISSVHDVDIEPTKIDHSFFSNHQTGQKSFYPDEDWPSINLAEDPIAEVLERHHHDGDPLFFPFTESLAVVDGGAELKKLDPKQRLLPTRVYWSLKKHSADLTFTMEEGAKGSSEKRKRQDAQVMELTRRVKIAFSLVGGIVEVNGESASFPPKLDAFWAKKENKTHMGLSVEINAELSRFYNMGQGPENRSVRMSAE
jgi:hypothetical protein